MKKIIVSMGDKKVPVSISKLDSSMFIEKISRIYAIGITEDGMVPLIFNSKRGIWGFPGGHTEEGETFEQTIRREFAEETGFNISNCEMKYYISSKLDEENEENQIISFCRVKNRDAKAYDINETVTDIRLVPVGKVLSLVGNQELWEDIIVDFMQWILVNK
jgi:8-oxo-dGTP pyrophosphatase MutT (NUDIX family)